MPKKIPLRQCLGCREMKPKRELIRVVRSPQGEISLDFSQAGKTICLTLPLTKEELGSGLGRTSCAMVAVTDVGFAASIAERLAQDDQETYGEAWQTLAQKSARVKQRRDAKRSPNKNKGKRRKA